MALARIACLLLLCWAHAALAAAPAFDAATSANIGISLGTSFSHTATGSNRYAVLCVGFHDPGQANLITKTYGGVDMPLVGSVGSSPYLSMYALVAPAEGAQTVLLEWDAFVNLAVIGVATFTGVHQTTPRGSFASANADSAGPATVNVTSAAGELVVDCVFVLDNISITVGSGQTARWEQDTGSINPGGSSTEAGAASVTMSWTLGTQAFWTIGGVPLKPVAEAVSPRRSGVMIIP
jgi:hypothetical protein